MHLAGELQPDVVLLGLQMPVMDGLTALPLIRHAAPQAVVVAVLSGVRDPAVMGDAFHAGADAFIDKRDRETLPPLWPPSLREPMVISGEEAMSPNVIHAGGTIGTTMERRTDGQRGWGRERRR